MKCREWFAKRLRHGSGAGILEYFQYLSWQEWQGSNLRPPVLETGALPIELHSYGGPASPPIRAVSSIGNAPIARAKRLTEPDRPITSGTAAHSFARQQRAGNPLFNPGVLRQTSAKSYNNKPYNKESKGRDHDPADR